MFTVDHDRSQGLLSHYLLVIINFFILFSFQELIGKSMDADERMQSCQSGVCSEKSQIFQYSPSIIQFPNTLFFLIKRYDEHGHKNYCKINININLLLDKYSNSSTNHHYKLRSVILHFGDTDEGHYASRVITELQNELYLTTVDDKLVSSRPISSIKNSFTEYEMSSAYVLIYDKIEDCFPLHFLIPLLFVMTNAKLFYEYFSNSLSKRHFNDVIRFSIVDDILNSEYSRIQTLLSNTNAIERNLSDFTQCLNNFVDYIYGSYHDVKCSDVYLQRCVGNYGQQNPVKICAPELILNVQEFTSASVKFNLTFHCSKLKLQPFKVDGDPVIFVTNMPKMLIICVKNSKDVHESNTYSVDLSTIFTSYYMVSCKINVRAVVRERCNSSLFYIARGKRWFSKNSVMGLEKEVPKSLVKSSLAADNSKVYLLCSVEWSIIEFEALGPSENVIKSFIYQKCMTLYNAVPPREDIDTFKMLLSVKRMSLENVLPLTAADVDVVMSETMWFNTQIIDHYAFKLKVWFNNMIGNKRVCFMECSWFVQVLINDSKTMKPVMKFNARNIHQFHKLVLGNVVPLFEVVFLPIWFKEEHFILYVIDFINKSVLCCDPIGIDHPRITDQILRYMYFEHFYFTGKKMYFEGWSVVNYSNLKNFPLQMNGYDCGPYVCMIMKSILLNLKFPEDACTFNFRKTILYEIVKDVMLV